VRPVRAPIHWKAWWWVQYAAVRGLALVALMLPPDFMERLARGMGRAYYWFDGPRRRTARENLRVALGKRFDEARREEIARASFEHAFVLLFEILWRERLVPDLRTFRRRTTIFGHEREGRDDVRAGRGGFLLTAHFGSWETAGAYMSYERVPFTGIARPVPNPYVQEFLMSTRRQAYSVFEKAGAVEGSLRVIRKGGWVAVVGDQNAGRHGVFVPFFGVPASTFPFVATLASMYGLRVYFGAAIRRGPRFRYDLHLYRYEPSTSDDHDERKLHLLEAYHRWIEEMVLLAPEQYLWMHRRYKTRPIGEVHGPHLPTYDHRGKRPRRPIPIRRRVGKLS
jgi:Kdo2-lipid IVA lauroyltransferase/acyltransferase